MLSPLSVAGEDLLDRHTDWFLDRVLGMLSDPLSALDPDVVRGTLRSVATAPSPDLSPWEWRVAAGIPHGGAIFDTAPDAVRKLTLAHLVAEGPNLTPSQERLLVAKALQGRSWGTVAEDLDFHSVSTCMRALGEAVEPLVECYGDETIADVDRFS